MLKYCFMLKKWESTKDRVNTKIHIQMRGLIGFLCWIAVRKNVERGFQSIDKWHLQRPRPIPSLEPFAGKYRLSLRRPGRFLGSYPTPLWTKSEGCDLECSFLRPRIHEIDFPPVVKVAWGQLLPNSAVLGCFFWCLLGRLVLNLVSNLGLNFVSILDSNFASNLVSILV